VTQGRPEQRKLTTLSFLSIDYICRMLETYGKSTSRGVLDLLIEFLSSINQLVALLGLLLHLLKKLLLESVTFISSIDVIAVSKN
jgi:hypothetical protein